jgi:hypothetical protein
MSSFDIDITNDGGWWMVHIREITGPAQGRTISEAESTARQMVALATGVRIDDIAVRAVGLAAPHSGIPAGWASPSSTRRYISASVIGSPDLG